MHSLLVTIGLGDVAEGVGLGGKESETVEHLFSFTKQSDIILFMNIPRPVPFAVLITAAKMQILILADRFLPFQFCWKIMQSDNQ